MNTEKLYDSHPYDTDFSAQVVSAQQTGDTLRLELDRTLFFPEEGGQSSDTGFIEGLKVFHVSIEGGRIIHEVKVEGDREDESKKALPGVSDRINGRIDWEHRFSNMQNHTGEHILSGILHRDYASENTGFHLSDNTVTLDTSERLDEKQLKELEQKANEAVCRNLPVTCRYYEKNELSGISYRSKKEFDEAVRLVTIEGIDVCACCAPHVRNTGEIGIIKILGSINYKGGSRLTILSGRRALEYIEGEHGLVTALTRKLSAAPEKLPEAVDRLLRQVSDLEEELNESARQRLFERLKGLSEGSDNAVIFTNDQRISNITQRNAVNLLAGTYEGICAVFVGEEKSFRFILSYPSGNALTAAKALRDELGAGCGGSDKMIQGSVNAGESEIREVLGRLG